jgi:[acyl-carrier-protein] S-malonyltransferase
MNAGMIFPGQASQFVGMGKDFYDAYASARELYRDANDKLGFDITELSFSGDLDELTKTKNAQPAILLHSLVVLAILRDAGINPSIVAGHSLGEFSALVAAGALRDMDALLIVRRRGELMYEAGLERPGTMAAIIGLDEQTVAECVREASSSGIVVIANHNSDIQLAISGEVEAVEAAVALAKEKGAKRAMKLQVSGAFHSPLMEKTAVHLMDYMRTFELRPLRIPWVANVTGEAVTDKALIHDLLFRQLSSPVRWVNCMRTLAGACADPLFEVGPGGVLSGLMKRIVRDREVRALSDVKSVREIEGSER